MLGRACQAAFLVALFLTSMGLGVVESSIHLEQVNEERRSQGVSGAVDVPTYRIGDEWEYETKFDVSQLLAQANVSASLNALTGDTVNEVTDIFYATDNNGDTVLAYDGIPPASQWSTNGLNGDCDDPNYFGIGSSDTFAVDNDDRHACLSNYASSWIQLDLGEPKMITGITQHTTLTLKDE